MCLQTRPGGGVTWLRSLPSPDALADLVSGAYALDVTSCVLVRSLVNDVYRVTTPRGRFALKVYRHDGRSLEEVGWEQDLANHVHAQGLRVAVPVPLAEGRAAGEIAYPEGSRPFTLYTWVTGRKPQPPVTNELFHQFGDVIARFHTAADSFCSAHGRRSFDVRSDLGAPATSPASGPRRTGMRSPPATGSAANCIRWTFTLCPGCGSAT